MLKTKIKIMAMVMLLVAVAKGGFACTCTDSASPRKALREAKAVFLGRVVAVAYEGAGDVIFDVLASWKGIEFRSEPIKVFSSPVNECAFRFEERSVYLVYALDGKELVPELPGELITDVCTRTRLAAEAVIDFRGLGRPRWHTEGAKKFLDGPDGRKDRKVCTGLDARR